LLVAVSAVQIGFLIKADHTATKAANAAEESANTERRTLTTVQRAFVFVDKMNAQMVDNKLAIVFLWRNSGSTPTSFMTTFAQWWPFLGDLPGNYDFPAIDMNGRLALDQDVPKVLPNTAGFIGPGGTMLSHPIYMRPNEIGDVIDGRKRAFVWATTRYQDVFGARHVTMICNEIKIERVKPGVANELPKGSNIAISFEHCARHNCIDEECRAQGFQY
jgi:hypothetical protein